MTTSSRLALIDDIAAVPKSLRALGSAILAVVALAWLTRRPRHAGGK